MERYIHNANMAHYRYLIAESERNPKRDEDRHKMLLTLLAEEIAKDKTLAADQAAFGSQAHHGSWPTSLSAVPFKNPARIEADEVTRFSDVGPITH